MFVTEPEVLQFVKQTFRSVWPFELLLLLSRHPQQAWQCHAIVHELRASMSVVAGGLQTLQEAGLISIDNQNMYRFGATSAELEELAHLLVELYNRKPHAVMRAIFSAPADRIQIFADAFRLRKDKC